MIYSVDLLCMTFYYKPYKLILEGFRITQLFVSWHGQPPTSVVDSAQWVDGLGGTE